MPVLRITEGPSLHLPPEVLDRLGLKVGDELSCEVADSSLTLRKTPPASIPPAQHHQAPELAAPIRALRGVGPRMADLLERLGIRTVEDALFFLPHRYEDRRAFTPIATLRPGQRALVLGTVIRAGQVTSRGGRRLFEALLEDGSGTITLKWFRGTPAYLARSWQPGKRVVVSGEVTLFGLNAEIHHPEADWVAPGLSAEELLASDPASYGRLLPVYHLTEGLQQRALRRLLRQLVQAHAPSLPDSLPPGISKRYGFPRRSDAVSLLHMPPADADFALYNDRRTTAHRSLAFDDFFYLELGMALRRRGITMEEGIPFQVTHRYTKPLLQLLPFSLTSAQRRVLTEIKTDMMAPHPMHRLVQGDVGCGKTMVALMAALVAVENGYQVAVMAPTEILAEQHYLIFRRWCTPLGVTVALVTSRQKGKERRATLEAIATGSAAIIVGTHAVIQEGVEFFRLGLGIIDEQHRFGVMQRGVLRGKGLNPDILVMTATPIPRTLAMTVFGDLALSVIDELPPGRTPIETRVMPDEKRAVAYRLIEEEVKAGRQAYLICPLVEESEGSSLKAATQMAAHLQEDVFPGLTVGLLHGRLKPDEKEQVMAAFQACETQVLVATTVIEVGIDVPNATLMVVEHAERFGLSQLHQLRGRVGRGTARSHCILMTGERVSEDGRRRLQVMQTTSDGFRIAEADLDIRGPGDFMGTRQSGLPDFRVANILSDGAILEDARREAFALVESDPSLDSPANESIRSELLCRWGGRLQLAAIG